MADKLLIYNATLILCGERKLASLTEDREPRRLLDDVWSGGAVKTCLEAGFWNFAMRSLKIEYDPSLDPEFGFTRAFSKPSDWVRTSVVSPEEYFTTKYKAHQFADEAGYWWADVDTLYVKMVSDGANYGNNLGNWTEAFTRHVEIYLASRIVAKLTKSEKTEEKIEMKLKRSLASLSAKDAMNEGTSIPEEGSWNRSRRNWGRRDGGNRGQLIG